MIIRNRLFALLYRIVAFILTVTTIALSVEEAHRCGYQWVVLINYFEFLVAFAAMIIFGLLIIFNSIDLKKGINGIAAGIYMPVALGLVSFSFLNLIAFTCYTIPTEGHSYGLPQFLLNIGIPLLVIADWVLFEEKGTVKWPLISFYVLLQTIYMMFMLVRKDVWSDVTLFNGRMVPYPFFDAENLKQGLLVLSIVIYIVGGSAISSLTVLLNNIFAGKYKNRKKL